MAIKTTLNWLQLQPEYIMHIHKTHGTQKHRNTSNTTTMPRYQEPSSLLTVKGDIPKNQPTSPKKNESIKIK